MSTIIPKDQMTEEDVKLNFITPALVSRGWQNKITMEPKVQFTDGKVNIKGNIVSREPAKKADYILYINVNNPIAIVEAKDNNHTVSFGLQQAMTYAQMMDITRMGCIWRTSRKSKRAIRRWTNSLRCALNPVRP